MSLRDEYNDLSDNILKKMLLNNYYSWKKKLVLEKDSQTDLDKAEVKDLEEKTLSNHVDLGHLTRDRLNIKK